MPTTSSAMCAREQLVASLGERAGALVGDFTARGLTVATCESLTAGLLAASIADCPGASRVLRGGVVCYATELKHTLAGVPREVLQAHGPVAPQTAAWMAQGARKVCGANVGLSLTGVAGPDPQDGKPVGTVYLGVAASSGVRAVLLTPELLEAAITGAVPDSGVGSAQPWAADARAAASWWDSGKAHLPQAGQVDESWCPPGGLDSAPLPFPAGAPLPGDRGTIRTACALIACFLAQAWS